MSASSFCDYAVSGPLPKCNLSECPDLFANEGGNAQAHYSSCRSGGHNDHAQCFHLSRAADDRVVGFAAVNKKLADLDDILEAWISVDYLYVLAEERGHGRSRLLRDVVYRYISRWLAEVVDGLKGWQTLRVMSASNIESASGRAFMEKLECELLDYCEMNSLVFVSTTRRTQPPRAYRQILETASTK